MMKSRFLIHIFVSKLQSYCDVGLSVLVDVNTCVVINCEGSALAGKVTHDFSRKSISSIAMSDLNDDPLIASILILNDFADLIDTCPSFGI